MKTRRSKRGTALPLVLLALVLVVATGMRASVISSISNFFGPGDPAVYYQMARGCLHHGVPRINFVHHFLTQPGTIAHVEDYYEPAFAYLLAVPMAIAGERPAAAALGSLFFGVLAVALVWYLARRHGRFVAVTAAAIVAFEPWSIFYSGVVMKEITVAAAVLIYLEVLRRGITSAAAPARTGVVVGVSMLATGLVQYELLPILALASVTTLALHRRPALPFFLTAAAGGGLALLGITWFWLGVPISAKYAFFLGRDMTSPEPLAYATSLAQGVQQFLPAEYVVSSVLMAWYPAMLLLAWLGARSPTVDRADRTIAAAFTISYLYFHAVPRDLWCRDFIPVTAVLAPLVALALHDAARWLARPWAPALAGGLLGFLFLAPPLLALGRAHLVPLQHLTFWLTLLAELGVAGVVSGMLWATRRWLSARRLRLVIPALLALTLLLGYWLSLPYPVIYMNAQFPDFETARAHRERVCNWVKSVVPSSPIMTSHPEEVELYSGFPAVLLPETARREAIEQLGARYGVRYLLVERSTPRDSILRALPVDEVGTYEGCTLFRFGTRAPGG